MNHLVITGFLGRDPEETETKSGIKYTRLSVGAKVSGKKDSETIWWNVTLWKPSKIIPHLKKGASVIVCGEMDAPRLFSSRSGENKVGMSMSASSIDFNGTKKDEPETNQALQLDDVPF